MRSDLLALSDEDLAALTNRGTVKRAAKEVESANISVELSEADDGAVQAKWSDGPKCFIAGDATLEQGTCDCAANKLCRHLVRTVIAYRSFAEDNTAEGPVRWNPGAITDKSLEAIYRKAELTRARKVFEAGFAAELVRSAKPTARLYQHACTLRFLVPGDPRYTYCDCAEPAPCSHVPLAVWAFRALDPDEQSGLVETASTPYQSPEGLLQDVESALLDLVELGISGASEGLADLIRRLAERLRAAELLWPATILDDLAEEYDRYRGRDALFRPDKVAQLVGEMLIRIDAMKGDEVPGFFVRGASQLSSTRASSGRYVGIGTVVDPSPHGPLISAHLVDTDSGNIVTVERRFKDPEDGEPKSFEALAQTAVATGVSLSALGKGQLLSKGGRRTESHRLSLGRTRAVVNPQSFEWEKLRAPVAAEDFSEVKGHLSALPPPSLRPRWAAADLFVVPVAAVETASFSPYHQAVFAVLTDSAGNHAKLRHPYTSRGAGGTEALLSALESGNICFVSGRMHVEHGELWIRPIGLILSQKHRTIVQPWVDPGPVDNAKQERLEAGAEAIDPIWEFLARTQEEVADLLVTGLSRADFLRAQTWRDLEARASQLGSTLLVEPIAALAGLLEQKQSEVRWSWRPAAETLLALSAQLELARGLRR